MKNYHMVGKIYKSNKVFLNKRDIIIEMNKLNKELGNRIRDRLICIIEQDSSGDRINIDEIKRGRLYFLEFVLI